MGSGSLIEIKRRLKSVQSTKKITNAMGLVATSKLRKCRRALSDSDEYMEISKKNMESLAGACGEELEIPYFKENNSNDKLYIIIASDSGLCAGYNANTISYLDYIIKDNKDRTKVMVVGAKGMSYAKRAGLNTIAEYVDIPEIPTVKEVKVIYNEALRMFEKGEVSEVNIVYTKFVSPVKQDVTVEKILPVECHLDDAKEITIEPDLETVLKASLDAYLKGKIRYCMLSSRCSEESSRMNAMDGATSNANDIIAALNIKYNRIRQAMITNEISEIVGGASAQK